MKVKSAYDWVIGKFPKEFTVVDGMSQEDVITEEILSIIAKAK